jgi:hypothetical protein
MNRGAGEHSHGKRHAGRIEHDRRKSVPSGIGAKGAQVSIRGIEAKVGGVKAAGNRGGFHGVHVRLPFVDGKPGFPQISYDERQAPLR